MIELDILEDYTNRHEKGHPIRGIDYEVWSPPMPRIDEAILDCVIYLYPSVADANAGEKAGGSGFLVGIPSKVNPRAHYLYAVTNSHVIKGKSPVVRLNTKEGEHEALPLTSDNWIHHPDGDDVAISSIGLSVERYKFKYIPTELFLTPDLIDEYCIGIGDDTFMVGRLMNHEGKQRNLPTARFGHIAMLPLEKIYNEAQGIMQESFLIESRSISGYSGSPVFVHLFCGFAPRPKQSKRTKIGEWWVRLLGINWGHFPIKEKVAEEWVEEYNTGMEVVVPAWKLMELLNVKQITGAREGTERKLAISGEDSARPDTETFSRSDFLDALEKASQRIEKPKPFPKQSKT